jgi:hypothetical protein
LSLIDELETAARWVNHQMDPCPDYEDLLYKAAAELKLIKSHLDEMVVWCDENDPNIKALLDRYVSK